MSAPHLTADQAEKFRRSDLNIEELARVLHHLDECPQCREQYLAEPVDAAAVRKLEADLLLLTWEGGEHLPDEQIIALGEGTLNSDAEQEIAYHLERCTSCRTQVEHIRTLHSLLMEQPGLIVSPLPHVTIQDDFGAIVLQGDRVHLEGVRKLPAATSRWISQLLTEGVVAPSKSLNAMRSLFKSATTPSPALRNAPLALAAPVNTVVRSSHPQLRWQPVSDAAEYSVVVMQVAKKNSRLVWKGSIGRSTECSLPPEVVIEPKQLYLWQVTTTIYGIETRSAFAWFSLLSVDAAAEVAEIEREYPASALILLGVCEKHGLYEEAQAHLHRLKELNPESAPVHNIAQRLEQQSNYFV